MTPIAPLREMPRKRRAGRVLHAFCALACVTTLGMLRIRSTDACSSSSERVAEATLHPDLPIDRYLNGHLGLIRPTFARSYLVIAYRYLSGAALSTEAQKSAARVFSARLNSVDAKEITVVQTPTLDLPAAWAKERTRILGVPNKTVNPSVYRNYAYYTSCTEGALRTAIDTLHDREKTYSKSELERWIRTQDQVFDACDKGAKAAIPAMIPTALPASEGPLARADRDYQRAATLLYADRFAEAEKAFRAIGRDAASPWQHMSRYLVMRTLARKATLSNETTIDKNGMREALREANTLIADPAMQTMRFALNNYRSWLRAKVDPAGSLADTAAELAASNLEGQFGQKLADYTLILDSDEKVLDAPKDDLTQWVASVQGKGSFDEALHKFQTTLLNTWLVATLMRATNARDLRLEPVLAAAAAIPANSPAFATARFHFLRLSVARAMPKAALISAVEGTLRQLPSDEGRSTRNAFSLLAARVAPDLDGFLAHAALVPAGDSTDNAPVIRDPKATASLAPEIIESFAADIPISGWIKASEASSIPEHVRTHLADAAWVRAMLVGAPAEARRSGAIASGLNPTLKPYVDRVESATSADDRRLSLLYALLKIPTLGPDLNAWAEGSDTEGTIDTAYGSYLWCAATAHPQTTLGTPAERVAALKETRALAALGAGSTWVSLEAVRLAKALPADPRIPETLHLAIAATHHGCTDDNTKEASKEAFQQLHSKYSKSAWTKKTPYYY